MSVLVHERDAEVEIQIVSIHVHDKHLDVRRASSRRKARSENGNNGLCMFTEKNKYETCREGVRDTRSRKSRVMHALSLNRGPFWVCPSCLHPIAVCVAVNVVVRVAVCVARSGADPRHSVNAAALPVLHYMWCRENHFVSSI